RGYGWGLTELRLNRELLSIGRFAVERASGVFADGTPFTIPGDADELTPMQLPENTRNVIVYLTLPISQPGGREAAVPEAETLTRYSISEIDVADANDSDSATTLIGVGKMRLRYALETGERGG